VPGQWVEPDYSRTEYFDDGSVEFLIACMPTYIIIRKHRSANSLETPG
jgi:hypothetical protein